MAKAQASIKTALKDAKNPHFKSSYADLTRIWEACREALSKNGLSVVQIPGFDANDVWLETMILHSSGESISGRYPLRPQQNTPQAYGSALTYARRYSLAAMVGVVADDDDGNAASQRGNSEPETRREATPPKPEASNSAQAEQWAFKAIEFIEACITEREIDAWYGTNAERLAKLQKGYGDLFRQVTQAMVNQRDSVSKQRDAAE
jgi:hypothetical protein